MAAKLPIQWSDQECRDRYREVMRIHPEYFHNPGKGTYEILFDDSEVAEAQQAAAKQRKVNSSTADLRVGVLADDLYALFLRDAVRFADGTLGLYNRLIVPASVVILPMLGDRIVLLYRYRHGTRGWHHEVPRGIVEPNELVEDAVRRELKEEMGADCGEIVPLGPLHSSNAISNEYSDIFLARVTRVGEPDPHEAVAHIKVLEPCMFRQMIAAGDITEGMTLAAYARALARGHVA